MPLVDPITMSTTLVKSGPAAQQPATKAAVPAIPLVNSPAALPASVAHQLLLAGLFYWRFDALVADPVSTLQTGLPVVAAIQAVYLILSLPPAGSSGSSKKPRPGEKRKSDGREAKAIPVSICVVRESHKTNVNGIDCRYFIAPSSNPDTGSSSPPCPLWRAIPYTRSSHILVLRTYRRPRDLSCLLRSWFRPRASPGCRWCISSI